MRHEETFRLGMDGVDGFQIVYFARYWDWYEHTFEGFLAAAGHALQDLLGAGVGVPVVHAEMDYRRPLRLGDLVRVEVVLAEVGHRSCRFLVTYRDEQGDITAEGEVVHTFAAVGMGPADAPSWLAALLEPQTTDQGPIRPRRGVPE